MCEFFKFFNKRIHDSLGLSRWQQSRPLRRKYALLRRGLMTSLFVVAGVLALAARPVYAQLSDPQTLPLDAAKDLTTLPEDLTTPEEIPGAENLKRDKNSSARQRPKAGPEDMPATLSPHFVDRSELEFEFPARKIALPPVRSDSPAAVLEIYGTIDMTTYDILARKVLRLQAREVELVIFDINTPGGRIDAAMKIVYMIRTDLSDVRTVAFVNTQAISAGAWIAVSCDEIVMTPAANIGDCAPISMGGALEGVEREKMETYLRSSFRQAAESNGYSPSMLETMVSAHRDLLHIKNVNTGAQRLASSSELEKLNAVDFASYVTAESDAGESSMNSNNENSESGDSGDQWFAIETIVSDSELLTLTTSEATRLGLVSAIASDIGEITQLYQLDTAPVRMHNNWSEKIVELLTSPAVTSVLVLLMLFFGSVEMRTPGVGVFGGIALVCLAILTGSRFLIGLAQWWELAVIVIGMVLIALEIFVIPGFGIAGISGIVLFMLGLLATLVSNAPDELPVPTGDVAVAFFEKSLIGVSLAFIAAVVLAIITGKYLPAIPVFNRLVLKAPAPAVGASVVAAAAGRADSAGSLAPGATGVLICDCRPSGKARFGNNIIDVATDGVYATSGTKVRVIEVRSTHLLVAVENADDAQV